jgi:hypothetical protein
VPINAATLLIINEPMPENDDEATLFDVWLHEATLGDEFNSL